MSYTETSTRRRRGFGLAITSSWHTRCRSPCGQSKLCLPMSGNSLPRRICTSRFSADHVAIIEARRPLLLAVRLPTARRPAPSAVPTMTRATSTSSSVKPRCRFGNRMSFITPP
ncbi:conserved hypothetical protein [Ricinus communis]|uniref:Uncharacterized protein n=1 Tax=Ricinus communis TaxID=3988 RepID=B9TLT3_RICCO|nr:conserved hypothetical protein [Ricinus communis]